VIAAAAPPMTQRLILRHVALSPARRAVIRVRWGPTGGRVVIGALLGAVAGTIAAFYLPWQATVLVGWDVACLYFLISTWSVVGTKSAGDTKAHAVSEDPSAPLADLVICSAAVACIVGAGFALSLASSTGGSTKAGLIALAALSVLLSWNAVHTVFALRYARLFYGASPKGTGIDFNEDDPPDYRDFAYLAMTIGMTFQVSDTDLRTKNIRRTALKHALISWLFGAVLVGLTINILASLLSGGAK
jgi:uncharacterized membrane protein